MESLAVDIDPGQIVRWVMAEHKTAPSTCRHELADWTIGPNAAHFSRNKQSRLRNESRLQDKFFNDFSRARARVLKSVGRRGGPSPDSQVEGPAFGISYSAPIWEMWQA